MSEGITSGVNCTRPYCKCSALEKARAMVVLPTPGMSSMRICPRANIASRAFTRTSSFPTTALRTCSSTSKASCFPSMACASFVNILYLLYQLNAFYVN